MIFPRRLLAPCIWLVALAAAVLIIVHTRFVADFSAFLPQAPNARQQLLVDQLRDGIIGRLIMVGIDGADPVERARLSHAMATTLRVSPAFVGVQNGEAATLANDQSYYFSNRYLLNDDVTATRFSAAGLREAISESLEGLSGSAGQLLKRLLPRDPTGETVGLIENLAGQSQPHSVEGVWASPDGSRALLLMQTRAAGSDIDGQATAIAAIHAAFDATHPKAGARLVMSGSGVISVASRQTIQHEVSRLALAGTALVICLLLAVYRSVRLLALGMLPVISGALAGVAAVSLGFGQVHGLTLGFGTTLIGEAVDYSIYLFIQRDSKRQTGYFWRIIGLGVLTSIAGFAALLCSGFPGLAQLGLYSVSGLITAALITRFVLPDLIPEGLAVRDFGSLGHILERIAAHGWRLRPLLLLATVAALVWLGIRGDSVWNRSLESLSPMSVEQHQVDASLRAALGAPDMRYMVAVSAPDGEAALQAAEKLHATLRVLTAQKVIGGFNSPALVLPSQAAQKYRQAALPTSEVLRANLAVALRDLPVHADRLEGFITDVETTRNRALLHRADLNGTSSAMLVDSLLVPRSKDTLAMLPLRPTGEGPQGDLIEIAKVEQALAKSGVAGATVIDLFAESANLYSGYLHEAVMLSAYGGIAIVILLLLTLRSPARVVRIMAPLLCAVVCVAALHVLGGRQMTLLHLVGLLLVVAVGSNYALFFDGDTPRVAHTRRAQTLVSLAVANCTSVASFGLLAFSQVPILSAIGSTVGPGAFFALVFSAILARRGTNDADPG